MAVWQKVYGNLFIASVLYWPILLLFHFTVGHEYNTIISMIVALLIVRLVFKITPHPDLSQHYFAFEIKLRSRYFEE